MSLRMRQRASAAIFRSPGDGARRQVDGPFGPQRPGASLMPARHVLPAKVRKALAKETRLALREHEGELAAIIRAAVSDALAETFAKRRQ